MIKPQRLKPGDTIGIVAPSSPFESQALDSGLTVLHRMGFQTLSAATLSARKGYLAGDDDLRLSQLQAMLSDHRVQAVMCARGGYGTLRLLAGLDYDLVRACAKPLIGFSDITALHQALAVKAGMVTFHGPVVTTLEKADAVARSAFLQALCGAAPCRLKADNPRTLLPGRASGRVVGGNLTVLAHLTGTPFSPQFKNCILVLEDVGEAPYRIDRMLTQMKMAGCFEGLAGVVLGSFQECGGQEELESLFQEFFSALNVPVAAGFAVGHTDRNITLPLGINARLDAAKGELIYLECGTRFNSEQMA